MTRQVLKFACSKSTKATFKEGGRHNFNKLTTHHICTYRNPLDTVASHYKVTNSANFANVEDLHQNIKRMGKEEIDHWIDDVHMAHFRDLNRFKKEKSDSSLFLRYERFYNDHDYLIGSVCGFVGTTLNPDDLDSLMAEIDIESNRKIADGFESFAQWDKDNMIHGFHVTGVEPGSWKKTVQPSLHGYYVDKLRAIMKEWGYGEQK